MTKFIDKKHRNLDWWIICGLAIIPWIVFVIFFICHRISNNINDWSAFGSYIGGTVAALTIPFSLYLLIKTYQIQKETELTTSRTLDNQKFERRLFELIGVFNEYRYNHLKGWTKTGDNPKEDYVGFSFFSRKRKNIQHSTENLKSPFDSSYIETISGAELNFEFYFRCLENILTTIEDVENSDDKKKLLALISNLLTNDEKFFVKYFDTFPKFSHFGRLFKYKSDLISDLYFDLKK